MSTTVEKVAAIETSLAIREKLRERIQQIVDKSDTGLIEKVSHILGLKPESVKQYRSVNRGLPQDFELVINLANAYYAVISSANTLSDIENSI